MQSSLGFLPTLSKQANEKSAKLTRPASQQDKYLPKGLSPQEFEEALLQHYVKHKSVVKQPIAENRVDRIN